MLLGVYGDIHLTKNMRSMQDIWEVTAMKSIQTMYDKFDELNVESAVCLGDFFDAPRIEAKSMNLVLPILESINTRTYPTYILLGNHEASDSDSNILEFLSSYENIIPITSMTDIEGMIFIPYYEDPKNADIKSDNIVFTHHDIYGSELASGKTKAFFGLDPDIFKDAKLVMNGHVHLKSKVRSNILNAGSLLVSQQGELKLGDYPSYYLLDTKTGKYETYDNVHSMIYLTIDESEGDKIVHTYDQMHCVLKVEYENEIPEIWIDTAHTSWKKKISSIGSSEDSVVTTSNFDMKNYLVEYLSKDEEIPEDEKEEYIRTGLELLS